ncbi:MAG: sulfatase [Deltaproteobacteria bacterium]|nr:sulfatase [Deltaproteobacteria bacterium]
MTSGRARGILVLFIGGVAIATVMAIRTPRPSERPNVILITVDTLRADRLSAYGYAKSQTPNMDRLAREGVLFENAFCDVTWTTSSMASVMTGRYATRHGLRSSYQRLAPETTTLAKVLRTAGLQTAAIVGSYPLDSVFGLDQGFDLYDDAFTTPTMEPRKPEATKLPDPGPGSRIEMRVLLREKAAHDAYRTDREVSDRAIRWLRAERREPFFLWVHYFGPHEKRHGADNYFEEVALQLKEYDADVTTADVQVGRVLDALDDLGLARRTAVILHADHGQSLAEHNFVGHGRYIYDVIQQVPLLIRLPGRLPAGRRVSQLVRNIDLLPTALALTGVALPTPVDGGSLLPLVDGSWADGTVETYVETYQSAETTSADVIDAQHDIRLGFRRLGIRTLEWKFIVNDPIPFENVDDPPPITEEMRRRYYSAELYDLRADPGETTNVITAHPDLAASFFKKVWAYQSVDSSSEPIRLDDTMREKLKSLGYLAD